LLFTSDAIRKFSLYEVYEKISGRNLTIYASRNVAVFREFQTQFGTSPPASFAEKVLDALSRFMHQKTKLFVVKFNRILEFLCVQGTQKMFWAQLHDLCVQKRCCFSVKFRRMLEVFGLQVLQKKFWAQFSLYESKNKAVSREIQTHVRSFRPASFAEKVLGAIFDLCVQKRSCLP